MSFWPFSNRKEPEASPEARAALQGSKERLVEADDRLHRATALSYELRRTNEVNHFGLAVTATMRGDTRP